MRDVGTVHFSDMDSNDEGIAVIRAAPKLIALALSLRKDGDIGVAMTPQDCRVLIDTLTRAVLLAES